MATIKEVLVPDLGNIASADIIEIAVTPGAKVNKEDTLITLESDKASMDIPSPYAGTVKDVKVKVGGKVSTGSVIVTMEVSDAETTQAPETNKEEAKKSSSLPPLSSPAAEGSGSKPLAEVPGSKLLPPAGESGSKFPAGSKPLPPAGESGPKLLPPAGGEVGRGAAASIHAGPAVRRIAREFGVDLSQVTATGPKNRILKEDVKTFVKTVLSGVGATGGGATGFPQAPAIDFSQFGPIENKSLSRIKKLTAINLHRNWVLIPHVTQFDEADITELEAFRKTNPTEKHGVKLTPLVFIMKAIVSALKEFPTFNASLDPSGEQLILKKYFHIGVAVDTPDGLVVPVIRDVDKKGLIELARELGDISAKARAKALAPADMQGSSFTISSLGGIGGTAFTPIVNLPDVAILGVSKAAMKPVYQEGHFVPRLMLPLSLSYDHRVIDGAEGARFIVYLSACLADIRRWLL